MIDLYAWATSNGRKIPIMLEEVELPYRYIPVDITRDEQFAPDFLRLNPNNKIPVIVDRSDGKEERVVFESGAILMYLAELSRRLMPADLSGRYEVLQWLFFQVGGVGPIFGQTHYFNRMSKEKVPQANERFLKETRRLYAVLDGRLAGRAFVAGEYSIADIALFPWISRFEWHDVDLSDYPNVARWYGDIGSRPAVQRGMTALDQPR